MSPIGRFCCRSLCRVGVEGRPFCRLLRWERRLASPTQPLLDAHATQVAASGGARATSLASLQRFWAIAASVNSSCAPQGPRSLSRLSLKMRFKCANSISTRLRSRRDCSNALVPASARATSRASSLISRGIMRAGVFGQHLDLRGHGPQSRVLAIYRNLCSARMRRSSSKACPSGRRRRCVPCRR